MRRTFERKESDKCFRREGDDMYADAKNADTLGGVEA